MKKWLLSLAVASAFYGAAAQANEPYSELKNQLEIFTGIIQTAARQSGDDEARLSDFRYTYVRDQGVIYRVRLGQSGWRFVAPDAPEPPMPPEAADMGEFARDLQLDVVVEQGLRTAHRILSKLSGEYSEEWFELSEKQRDLAWDIREQERELRDIEFRLRNAEDSEKAELTRERNEIKRQLDELRAEQSALREKSEALKQELKAEREKIRQQQIETRDKAIANAEQLLSKTLCDYGITLKALPQDEFVTFILEGADNSAGERRRDRVYVFAMDDIRECSGNDGAVDLIEAAKPYYF